MIYTKLYLKRTPSGQTYEKRLKTKKSLTNLKEEALCVGLTIQMTRFRSALNITFRAWKVGRFPSKILPFHLFQIPNSAHVAISKNLGHWKLPFAS
jgi:hypothetical protein